MKRSPIYERPREKYVYFYVTNECQLRCKHCFVGNERLNTAERFDIERISFYLDYFRAQGGHDRLYILGGEPTLHPQLPEFVDLALAKDFDVTITSNGDFADDLFDRLPPSKVSSFNFSLESADPLIHWKIRGRRDSFDKVVHKIQEAAGRGYRVRISSTISQANRAGALDLIPFVAGLGAGTISFHNTGFMGNAKNSLTPLTPSEWMSFCDEIEASPPPANLAVYYPPTYVPMEQQEFWAYERGYPGCPAKSLDRPHLYPDGTVYACPLLMDNDQYFAKFDGNHLRVNPSPNNELNAYFSVSPSCLGCPANQTCGGGCPAFDRLGVPRNADKFNCDREITPLCMLWTTYAWGQRPDAGRHRFR